MVVLSIHSTDRFGDFPSDRRGKAVSTTHEEEFFKKSTLPWCRVFSFQFLLFLPIDNSDYITIYRKDMIFNSQLNIHLSI